jgi:integrase/recombinase XerC
LRFVGFVEHTIGGELNDVCKDDVMAFLGAASAATGAKPSVATQHLRRSGVRLLFRVLRRAGIVDRDPTIDIVLAARSSMAARPLTDAEIALGRSFALHTLTATRQPAAWALAEASARTSEIHSIGIRDVDLDAGRLWIPGSTKTKPRFGELTEWGVRQLDRRIRALGAQDAPATPLVYEGAGSAESRQASSCAAIAETLRRSGLNTEPDVRPVSVAAWAGRRAYDASGRIEDAARVLGVRSLDRAARLIEWNWTDPPERS